MTCVRAIQQARVVRGDAVGQAVPIPLQRGSFVVGEIEDAFKGFVSAQGMT
jgi:hypothetical protein